MAKQTNRIKIAILGASGYTGAELIRLLSRHPAAELALLTAERHAGKALGQVFPHLSTLGLPELIKIEDADWDKVELVFCGLPHSTTQEVIAALPRRLKVIDLSADFRLEDAEEYAKWYGHPHLARELQKEAVYGLTELKRDALRKSRLCAVPGCYPTAALLPLVPVVAAGQIDADDIIVDCKSGVTGAGRSLREDMLFAEVSEGIHAYGVAHHRHTPEMEQELSAVAGRKLKINFTPHLMPMNRGILSTIYVRLAGGAAVDDLRATLEQRYSGEPFVRVVVKGSAPATRHVRGSNHCLIGVFADRVPGRAILISVIDNLVKGAAGQAVQDMNVMQGLAETAGLEQQPLFP
ncbi:MAG TPA: N-acetyl-gamma-glutamyl-phosphate reductase [Alphaproteobacteria bacterium]|nr:N-acetyl-gamma-glutamyl-phosphate reductase [Alphaproteobacteria bacterium]